MSQATGPRETEEFAERLRDLKDRSGLSYGALAKRLHMSTSTLHRYCNGTAVPNDYAPVERLARLCRATPQELVELHRRWILADAARKLRADQAAAARSGAAEEQAEEQAAGMAADPAADPAAAGGAPQGDVPGGSFGPSSDAPAAPQAPPAPPASGTRPAPERQSAAGYGPAADPYPAPYRDPDGSGADGPGADDGAGEPVVVNLPATSQAPRRRRRTALIASASAAAVVVATVLAIHPWSGSGDGRQATGTVASRGPADTQGPSTTPAARKPSRTPSASSSATGTAKSGTGASHGSPKQTSTAGSHAGGGVPLAVRAQPYVYPGGDPCWQHFLVDSQPEHMGPPPNEQGAPRWAAAYGAVASDEQDVGLTVQGTSGETVVLEGLHVNVLSKGAPLAWNDYSVGVGCGGNVDTKGFGLDLDSANPAVKVQSGQGDFPYKVSESDPEVFYVFAHTKAHDVRWELTLDWSSPTGHGTIRIDNDGVPFRTSADIDRPGYDYPLGYTDWIKRDEQN